MSLEGASGTSDTADISRDSLVGVRVFLALWGMLMVRRFSDRSLSAKKEKARFVTLEASEGDDYATGLKRS